MNFWNILFFICFVVFVLFTFVIIFGAPFLPTLNKRVKDAVDLARLKPGEILLELGSGDGRILGEAAKRGIVCIGYEINPLLVLYSKLKLWRYRNLIDIKWANFWIQDLPNADAVFVFLLQPYMEKLDKKLVQDFPQGVKLVSFAFTIADKKPTKVKNGMYLYRYSNRLKNKQN